MAPIKHGGSKRSGKKPEYVAWKSMKTRCYCESFIGYKDYGGRGIKVCERWLNSYENFYLDMGERPSNKHSLDRIDPNKNYEPSNCRWADRKTQNSNTRTNHFLIYNDEVHTVAEWARRLCISQSHLCFHLEKRSFPEVVTFFENKRKGKWHIIQPS